MSEEDKAKEAGKPAADAAPEDSKPSAHVGGRAGAAHGGEPAEAAPPAVPQPEREAASVTADEPPAGAPRAKAAAEGDAAAAAGGAGESAPADPEREAKLKAAAEARAARAAAKAAAEGGAAPAEPKPPSPNQPRLDAAAALLRERVHPDAVEEALINEPNNHLPTLVIRGEHWYAAAELFRTHDTLRQNYLRNVSGVDYETHLEVVYHLINLDSRHEYAIRVKADRESPSVPSVTPIWPTANWNEREIYDLLGIDFPGHPDLRRIMMPDDWVGYPLRKDYEPLDPEV